KNYSGWVYQSS
nr:spermadhesin AQN-3 - pig (fragments) [Sus scrofa domesticus]